MLSVRDNVYYHNDCLLVSKHIHLLGQLSNPCCRCLLRNITLYSIPTEPTCCSCCNYAEWTMNTVTGSKRIIWHDLQFKQGQYTWVLIDDDLWLHVSTTINGFWIFPSIQFHSGDLGQPMVLFLGTFQRWCTLWLPSQADNLKRFPFWQIDSGEIWTCVSWLENIF